MTNATITRTALINLSDLQRYCGLSSERDTTFPNESHNYADYRQRNNLIEKLRQMGAVDREERDTCGYRYPWIVESASTYNEAVIENCHHDALISNGCADALTAPEPTRQAQGEALATMRRREAQSARDIEELRRTVASQRNQIDRLQVPITDGADSRLDEFWTIAGQAATDEGFCPEYDRIATALGGQSRRADYNVTLTITTTVQVSLSGMQRGEDITMEDIRNQYTTNDIESNIDIDWSQVEVEDYDEE